MCLKPRFSAPSVSRPVLKDILVQVFSEDKIKSDGLSERQRAAVMDLSACHTDQCGYVKEYCPKCQSAIAIHYGSCNNINCPECGVVRREQWVDKMGSRLPKAPYYHIIFTVPDRLLNPMFLADAKKMDNILLASQAEALKEISADPKYFGVYKPGFFSVLHTWGSTLSCHHHVHTVFCAAGLTKDNTLVVHQGEFLFPAKKLAKMFKTHFIKRLSAEYEKPGSQWNETIARCREVPWNVEIRESAKDPDYIVKYLGRYVNRTAISNGRILAYEDGKVKFSYKAYKCGNRKKPAVRTMVLEDTEFVRRFLMHIPPLRFQRTRYYGFLGYNQKEALKLMKELTGTEERKIRSCQEIIESLNRVESDQDDSADPSDADKRCPHCGGRITVIRAPRDSFRELGPYKVALHSKQFLERVSSSSDSLSVSVSTTTI